MAATPEHIARAARLAANKAYKMMVGMLANGETGEVVIEVGAGYLQPEKRVRTKAKAIHVTVGAFVEVEASKT